MYFNFYQKLFVKMRSRPNKAINAVHSFRCTKDNSYFGFMEKF